jgi:hypothetical protein
MNRISKSVVLLSICALATCIALIWFFFNFPDHRTLLLSILLAIFTTVAAVAGIGETRRKEELPFFRSLTGRGRVLLICLVLVLAVVIGKEILTQQDSAKQQKENEGLRGEVRATNKAQMDNTQVFLDSLKKLSEKISDLETQVKTKELQQQLATVKDELQKTQKALAPGPKAVLAFSFEPFINPPAGSGSPAAPVTEVKLPVLADGNVRVEFTVLNLTDVDALEGFINLIICDECKFVKEPTGFKKVQGLSDRERSHNFQRILRRSSMQTVSVDVIVPPKRTGIRIGITYRCRTCVLDEKPSEGIVHLVR